MALPQYSFLYHNHMIQFYLPCFPNLDYLSENIPLRIVNKTLLYNLREHEKLLPTCLGKDVFTTPGVS